MILNECLVIVWNVAGSTALAAALCAECQRTKVEV